MICPSPLSPLLSQEDFINQVEPSQSPENHVEQAYTITVLNCDSGILFPPSLYNEEFLIYNRSFIACGIGKRPELFCMLYANIIALPIMET